MRVPTLTADRLETLLTMLTYRRPHESGTEAQFCQEYLLPLPNAWRDSYGNIHVKVSEDRVLWSAHTDTVHWMPGRQRIKLGRNLVVRLHRSERRKARKRFSIDGSNCLGADDTAGCFLMREMILAGVPGYYLFHAGEEKGGIGSGDLAQYHSDWLSERFDYAIAFDRRGRTDVITRQMGGRCASNAFAVSLADELSRCGLDGYRPDDTGVFTDTANYTDAIPECTNLSVGYDREHTSDESLDTVHMGRLLNALLRIDLSALVVERNPLEAPVDVRNGFLYDWPDENEDEPADGEPADWRRDDPMRNLYLDPDWQDVQDALAAMERRWESPA